MKFKFYIFILFSFLFLTLKATTEENFDTIIQNQETIINSLYDSISDPWLLNIYTSLGSIEDVGWRFWDMFNDPQSDFQYLMRKIYDFYDQDNFSFNIDIGNIYQMLTGIEGYSGDMLSTLQDQYSHLSSLLYSLDDIKFADNQFYDYLYQYSLGSNVEASKTALESIVSNIDDLEISVTQLGDKIDQIVVNGNNTSDDLQTIIAELQKLNGDSSGSSSQLPVTTVGFYELEEYGKDVNTENLSFSSLTTSGEFNKDVYNLLIHLNELGSSQNNALISMLTNVQFIASSVGGTAEGEDKVEKDIEERGYKADQANQELNSIVSQSFETYFAPPRVSEVFNGVTVSLSDTELPSRITIIDTFHFESESFSAELNDIGFDVPTGLLDLAHYGRIVFGFLYWTAAVYIALFVFRLWIKLYTYVSGLLN